MQQVNLTQVNLVGKNQTVITPYILQKHQQVFYKRQLEELLQFNSLEPKASKKNSKPEAKPLIENNEFKHKDYLIIKVNQATDYQVDVRHGTSQSI